MKVHIIEPRYLGDLANAVAARDKLGKAIGDLTRQTRETVWFHDYKDTLSGGAPLIFIECSDEFLELVKELPGVKKTYDSQPAIGKHVTERSEKMQAYFTGDPNKFVNYYSIQFKPVRNAPAAKDKMTDIFNFKNLITHARWSFMHVMDYLDQNNLLHKVSDVHSICNENRMILRCPDALVEDLKKLHCVESIRPLTAQEIRRLCPHQTPPDCPPEP